MKKIWLPAVQYIIVDHRNLNCRNCDHGADSAEPSIVNLDEFKHDIKRLALVANVGELRILGGEPLLHPDIDGILKVAREINLAEEIVLITNGVLLDRLSMTGWEMIDGLWLSIYPGVNLSISMEILVQKATQHDVWIWKRTTDTFFDLYLEKENKNKSLVEHIYRKCLIAHYHCNVLRKGRYFKCPSSVWVERRLREHGIFASGFESDSLNVNDDDFADKLSNFIELRTPLRACSFCLGTLARSIPHSRSCDLKIEAEYYSTDSFKDRFRNDMILPALLIDKLTISDKVDM